MFFDQIVSIYKYFQHYKNKKLYAGTALKKLIAARWEGHCRSTVAILENYKNIYDCLEKILDGQSGMSTDEITMAQGIFQTIRTKKFLYTLFSLPEIFAVLEPSDKALQDHQIGYNVAAQIIKATTKRLEDYQQSDQLDILCQNVALFITENEIDIASERRRRLNADRSEEAQLRGAIFEVLDTVIIEIKRRFQENDDFLLAISAADKMDLLSLAPLFNAESHQNAQYR